MEKYNIYICSRCACRMYKAADDKSPARCSKCGNVISRKFELEPKETEK